MFRSSSPLSKRLASTGVLHLVMASTLFLIATTTSGAGRIVTPDIDNPNLKRYESKYYVIHTDLAGDDVRETILRMTKMAEEYYERTRDFSGVINTRLPFLMFSSKKDYYAAGGMPGSAGVFMGDRLMAIAGNDVGGQTWHIVQHEGFHQFAHAVIRGDLPVWANEGLAEYFGEGVFTGDGFVTGVIPSGRLARIKKIMKAPNGFMPINEMLTLSHHEWNGKLTITNYDQAWTMVHFLAHAEDGKYQKAFTGFMRDIGRNTPYPKAWQTNFGDPAGFEQRWRDYWLNLPDRPTMDLYSRAFVSTLTSFLARATAEKQTFDTFEEFLKLAKQKQIKTNDEDWLPPQLAVDAAGFASKVGKWSISSPMKQPTIVMEHENGTRFVAAFTLRGKKVDRVTLEVDDLKTILTTANELLTAGKKTEARSLVQDGLRKNPKSAVAEEAKKYIVDTK